MDNSLIIQSTSDFVSEPEYKSHVTPMWTTNRWMCETPKYKMLLQERRGIRKRKWAIHHSSGVQWRLPKDSHVRILKTLLLVIPNVQATEALFCKKYRRVPCVLWTRRQLGFSGQWTLSSARLDTFQTLHTWTPKTITPYEELQAVRVGVES